MHIQQHDADLWTLESCISLRAASAHPQAVVDDLVQSAEAAGGLDNATAVVIRFGDCPPMG